MSAFTVVRDTLLGLRARTDRQPVVDSVRYWISTFVGTVTAAAVAGVWILSTDKPPTPVSVLTVSYFVGWVVFCTSYIALVRRMVRALDGAGLIEVLHETGDQRRRRRRGESMYGTGGPSGAVALCAVALAAVLASSATAELRSTAETIVSTVVVVAVTWAQLVTVYALHYAREHTNHGGLTFPSQCDDDVLPVFGDFAYLSIHVATSYATSDVTVTTTPMRRQITTQNVIAFVYNTVVVALLVSMLISAAT